MDNRDKAHLAAALGASRVIEIGPRHAGGPLDLLALRVERAAWIPHPRSSQVHDPGNAGS